MPPIRPAWLGSPFNFLFLPRPLALVSSPPSARRQRPVIASRSTDRQPERLAAGSRPFQCPSTVLAAPGAAARSVTLDPLPYKSKLMGEVQELLLR